MGDRPPVRMATLESQWASLGARAGFATVHGQPLHHVLVPGAGDPFLLCGGVGANLELGLPLAQALVEAGVGPVVLFDLPGIGRSPPARRIPGLGGYARLAVGLLDALGLPRSFTVAGVSWGGALAQRIARDHRARAQRLVLMATTAGIVMVPGRLPALLRMATPYRYLSRDYLHRHAADLYGGELRGSDAAAELLGHLARAPTMAGYLQQLSAVALFSSLPWLHRLECPALVMGGDDDPLIRTINLRVLAACLPRATLRIVPAGGHLFMVMRPQLAAREIAGFLADARAREDR